jgi:sigma-B regulation protein RsbU (phosphoserine phosphatase)
VLYWAGFLVISMTAILVSTAISLIRVRVRMERVQHEVLTRELSQARQIQLNWLPNQHSAGPALDIAAINQPASHISGDFYNWFTLPDGRQVITIGDVTGHGMAAAFLMATTQLLVRTTMPRVKNPGECMEEVNRQLCTQVFHGQFVTMLIVVLDLERGQLELATAGHCAPLISEAGGEFKSLPIRAQLVLAVDSETTYPTERFQFDAGSSMLLYTDGVVDVQAKNGDRFDTRRLRDILIGPFVSAQAIVDRVVSTVNAFREGRELGDDLTLVAIQTQSVPRGTHLTQAAEQNRASLIATSN